MRTILKGQFLNSEQSFAVDVEVDQESLPLLAGSEAAAAVAADAMYAPVGSDWRVVTTPAEFVAVAVDHQQKGNRSGLAAGCNLAMAEVQRSAWSCDLAAQDILA